MNRKLLKDIAIVLFFAFIGAFVVCVRPFVLTRKKFPLMKEKKLMTLMRKKMAPSEHCSMFKEISTECVCLIYMDLVRNTVILLHYFWRFLVRNRDKLQDMPD